MNRSRMETAVLVLLWAGAVVGSVGALAALSGIALIKDEGQLAVGVGILLSLAATALGLPINTLRVRMSKGSGGAEYEHLRRWGRLKTASILLQMLGIASSLILLFSVLASGRALQVAVDIDLLGRGDLVLVLALLVGQAVAHLYALRTPIERDRTSTTTIVAYLGIALAALIAAVAVLVILGQGERLGAGARAAEGRTELLLLGAAVVSTYTLFMVRDLPTLSILTSEERAGYAGGPRLSRTYNVFLPVIVAFGLLLLVFLLFVAFGVGLGSLVSEVAQSPILLGVVAFLVVAIAASGLLAVRLARAEAPIEPLFKKPVSRKVKTQNRIIAASAIAALLLLVPAGLLFEGYALGPISPDAWIHFLCLGLLVALGPYGFYAASEHRRIRRLEERFPDFLRDVASSHKGGLTLSHAATIASRGEYGTLTPEIRKMADQLSWNVSFSEALERFSDRVQTPLVERAVSLILQANKSGGATTDVLLAAARDAREIKNLENERRLSMSLYTIVIYITFFVFLGVAAVLYAQFVPQIVASSEAAAESNVESVGLGSGSLRVEQFQLFYFMAAVVQGLGDGIVAGMMGQGKAVLGLRHAFLMVLISYLTFTLFLV